MPEAKHEPRRYGQRLQPHHAAQVGCVHLLAHAMPFARDDRGKDPVGEHHGAHLVGGPACDGERIHVGLAGGEHDPRARLAEHVEGRVAALGPLGPVARGRGIDQLQVVPAQIFVAEPQTFGDTLAEVLHEDVGLRDEPMDDLSRLGLLQVERDRELVAVVALEVGVRNRRHVEPGHRQHAAPRVAADALLDLDHLGAEIA